MWSPACILAIMALMIAAMPEENTSAPAAPSAAASISSAASVLGLVILEYT